MNVVRRVARNISFLFAWQAVSRFLGLVLNIVLTRRLEDAGYGRYSIILVIVMIAGMFADFGTANIVVREISRHRDKANSILGALLVLRGVTTVTVWLGAMSIFVFSGMGRDYAVPLAIASLSIIPMSMSTALEAALQGFERMDLSALADAVFSLALTGAGVAVVYRGGGVVGMTAVYLGASTVRLGYSFLAYRRLDRARGGWRFTGDRFIYLVRESFPVLYWQLVSLAYYKIDVLLLGAFRTEAEVGWYAAAYKLFEVPVMFGWLAVQALLPLMSRTYQKSKDSLGLMFEKVLKYIWTAGLGTAVLLAVLARPVIELLLPPEFEPSILALITLGYAIPLMVGCVLFGNLYIAMNVQGQMARWSLLSLLANLSLNLALIPVYGLMGAAVATLLAEIFTFLLFYGFTAHLLRGVRLVEVFVVPAAAAGIVLVAQMLLDGLWAPLLATGGALAYLFLLWAFRVFSLDDRKYFRQLRAGG
ncbi:MAG: flippase [Thermoleophilia bacterium]